MDCDRFPVRHSRKSILLRSAMPETENEIETIDKYVFFSQWKAILNCARDCWTYVVEVGSNWQFRQMALHYFTPAVWSVAICVYGMEISTGATSPGDSAGFLPVLLPILLNPAILCFRKAQL